MGTEIHAIKTEKGFRYKEYSTTSDMYNTPSLSEDEMKLFLLSQSIERGGVLSLSRLEERLEMARKTGSSNPDERDSKETWKREPTDYWGMNFRKRKSKKAFLEDIEYRLNMTLRDWLKSNLVFLGSKAKDFEELL